MKHDEDWDIGDDVQEGDCSDAKEAGPQDTSADEPSEEYMV